MNELFVNNSGGLDDKRASKIVSLVVFGCLWAETEQERVAFSCRGSFLLPPRRPALPVWTSGDFGLGGYLGSYHQAPWNPNQRPVDPLFRMISKFDESALRPPAPFSLPKCRVPLGLARATDWHAYFEGLQSPRACIH